MKSSLQLPLRMNYISSFIETMQLEITIIKFGRLIQQVWAYYLEDIKFKFGCKILRKK